jgi:hypothetical protein
MIDVSESKTKKTTCLKNMVEHQIFNAYRSQYSDPLEGCQAYLNGNDPTIRAMVVRRMRGDHQTTRETGANEWELRKIKKQQKAIKTSTL